MKKTLIIFLILLIGGLGGILADQFLLPYLATLPLFSGVEFIQQAADGTTIVNPKEEIIITENTALEKTIDKIAPCIVAIRSYQGQVLLEEGTGFLITSDGLLITASDLIPVGANRYLVYRNGGFLPAQIVKRDLAHNLVLLKIEENNLPVVSLADLENLRLGQRIVLVGGELIEESVNKFVNLGIIRSISRGKLEINLEEENSLANGSPSINIQGQVIGLNLIDSRGLIKIVPVSKIKEFVETVY